MSGGFFVLVVVGFFFFFEETVLPCVYIVAMLHTKQHRVDPGS